MPPSAISGMRSCRASATRSIAVTCGTPTPATTRVVQIEPGPIPTFTASAPLSSSASAASPVQMLPPMTCTFGKFFLTQLTRSSTPCEWPCAVSTTITSTPAATSASTRRSVSPPTPTAAPTSRRVDRSLAAFGKSVFFWMSLTVIRPRSSNESLTTSTFSMRLRCSSCSTSSDAAPSLTVIRRSFLVMMWRTGSSSSVSKRMSRWVTMPASRPSLPTTGTPEMLCAWVRASTSRMVVSGPTVIGSRMTPASNFLTLATSAACCSRLRFLWMMPMPPSWAMAMARRASVTVSMAADRIGSFSFRSRVNRVSRLTSLGRMVEWAGTSETSS